MIPQRGDEADAIWVVAGVGGGLGHQRPDRVVAAQVAPDLLEDQVGGLAAQHGPGPRWWVLSSSNISSIYLRERYYRLAARRGKQRAIVAIEHSLLTAIWHMITNNIDYHDLGPDHFTRREPAHVMRRITKQANALGYTVRFDPLQQTAAAT